MGPSSQFYRHVIIAISAFAAASGIAEGAEDADADRDPARRLGPSPQVFRPVADDVVLVGHVEDLNT
jgi:hypothetical protein